MCARVIAASFAAATLFLGCDRQASAPPAAAAPVGQVQAPLATETLVVNPSSSPVRAFVQNKVGVNVLGMPTVNLAAGTRVATRGETDVLLDEETDQGVGYQTYPLDVTAYRQIRVTVQRAGLVGSFSCTVSAVTPGGTRMPMRKIEPDNGNSFASSVFDVPGTDIVIECPRSTSTSTIQVLVHGRP